MIRFLLLAIALFELPLYAACIAVNGEQILAKHLVEVDNAFSTLDPNTVFSYSPTAGMKRIVSGLEVTRWAAANGVHSIQNNPVCFERTGHPLTKEEIVTALKQVLSGQSRKIQIDIVDSCREILPLGTPHFELTGATLPPVGHPEVPILWRGDFVTLSGVHYPIWVRARVLVLCKAVRAMQDLRTGTIITPNQLEETESLQSPMQPDETKDKSFYVGKIVRQMVSRGTLLEGRFVRSQPIVERGSFVQVDVFSGTAHIRINALANSSGNLGDTIVLTNPASTQHFRGVVTGRNQVKIIVPDELLSAKRTVERNSEKNPMINDTTFERGL